MLCPIDAGLNAWIGSLLDGLPRDPILICFLATVVMVLVTQVSAICEVTDRLHCDPKL